MEVPFLDLGRRYVDVADVVESAALSVLRRGNYVLGDEVKAFEVEFAAASGANFGVGVGNGTDALTIALAACDVGNGDEVITVANTAIPTVSAIVQRGAAPVYCDIVEASYTMDPGHLEELINDRTKAIVPVHLYGHMAAMPEILEIAARHDIRVIEDCAQCHGASLKGIGAGGYGVMGCFSFYPTKNLGGYGDGGFITTDDEAIRDRLKRLRVYGQSERNVSIENGYNSRLDELQAAILRTQLPLLDRWNKRRREIAEYYRSNISPEHIQMPQEADGAVHVYHLYVVRVPERDLFRKRLQDAGVQTDIYYPLPLYDQQPYLSADAKRRCSMTDKVAGEIVALPLNPYLTDDEVEYVAKEANKAAR